MSERGGDFVAYLKNGTRAGLCTRSILLVQYLHEMEYKGVVMYFPHVVTSVTLSAIFRL
jgi:predicted GTPase